MFLPFGLGLGDHNLSTVPLLYYLSDSLGAGRFPLWDPQTLAGLSLAGGVIGSYHPLNFLLFRFLPFPTALNLYLFSIFLILGFGTFYFIKSLRLSPEAALVSALSFTFASGVVARIIHLQILGTIVYLPLLLFLTQKFFEKRNPLLIILTGLTLALQIFYGHQPAVFISSIAWVGFFLFKALTAPKPKKVLVNLSALGAVFLIGLSLSAVHLIPGGQLFLASDRAKGVSAVEFKEYPFHPGELTYFLRPTPIGNPSLGNYDSPYLDPGIFWENTAYIGLLGVILAALAFLFLFRSQKIVAFFSLLFLLSVILALGKFAPLAFIWQVPPFSFFRMPARFLLLAMFSLATLAAFGFDGLTQKIQRQRSFLALGAAIFILFDLFPFASKYNATYPSQKWLSPPQSAQIFKEDPSFFRIYSLGGYEAYYQVYRQFRGWQKDIEPYFNLREGLTLNLNLLWGLNLAGAGWGDAKSNRWQEILGQNMNLAPEQNLSQPNPSAIKMLRLLNVKYVVSYFKIVGDDFILKREVNFTTEQPGFYLYELKNPYPHAFVVYQVKTAPSPQEVLEEFTTPDFDPTKTVLLEEPFNQLDQSTINNQQSNNLVIESKAKVTSYEPERLLIKADASKPGLLVLTDTNFPGWEAKVDGEPTKIYQANYLFRAVRLSPGEHQIEFEYKPKEVYLGAKISLTSLGLIIVFSLSWILKSRFSTKKS